MSSMHSATELDSDPRLARKRVPRACDHCRRRKSRCDGQANCSACRSIGLSCSYGHSTVKQARGPTYVAQLERTVEELQSQARRQSATQISGSSMRSSASPSSASSALPNHDEGAPPVNDVPSLSHSQDTRSSKSNQPEPAVAYVEIMAREPRAKSFGVDVLRQLCNFCYDLPRPGGSHRQDSAMKIVHALDTPFSLDDFPSGGSGIPALPPNEVLFSWIELAFSEALPLWHFVDKAYVERIPSRLWSTSTVFGQDENDKDDLALLYAILALGQRFEIGENGPHERRMQGLTFFAAARDAVPLASCERSIPAIQTVLCMALFLNAASAQTRFHAYVSSAASAALRLGLHEQVSGFAEDEQALRRRVWFAVQAMDVYASSALGLPSNLSSAEAQTESFGNAFPGLDEMTLATAAHHQLTGVLSNCIDRIYRDRESKAASGVQSNVVSTTSLRESSEEMTTWGQNCGFIAAQLDALALTVNDGSPAPMPQIGMCSRTQLLLCYTYCHSQLLLYTPLVHHLVQPTTPRTSEAYLYGTRCMRAALLAVHIAEELQRRFQMNEAYFQTVDVLINALLVLLTVELGSSDGALLRDAIPAGRRAKDILFNLCPLSAKASQCWEALAPLYQNRKNDSFKGQQSVRRNVADIRDSFKNSYNTHYASVGSVDPMQLWTNEPMVMMNDEQMNG